MSNDRTGPPSRSNKRRYSPNDLRTIGEQCSRHLPPISSVNAMFLYEMQRADEAEQLFQGAMFDLARHDEDIGRVYGNVSGLEGRLQKLETRLLPEHPASEIGTGKVELYDFNLRLKDCAGELQSVKKRLARVEHRVDGLVKERESENVAAECGAQSDAYTDTALWCDIRELRSDMVKLAGDMEKFHKLDADVELLFRERDTLSKHLEEAEERQTKMAAEHDSFKKEVTGAIEDLKRLVAQQDPRSTLPTTIFQLPRSSALKITSPSSHNTPDTDSDTNTRSNIVGIPGIPGSSAIKILPASQNSSSDTYTALDDNGYPSATVKEFIPGQPWAA